MVPIPVRLTDDTIHMSNLSLSLIDNLFIKFFASLTGHDVVILPVHPESDAINKEFTWVFGIIVSDLNVLSSPLFCRWKSDE